MDLSVGTIAVLYYGVFMFIFYMINKAAEARTAVKLVLSLPSILFVSIFPYWIDSTLFIKFMLTVVGFFTCLNIVDLVFLDPVKQLSFKDYMFFLSTASRPFGNKQPTKAANPNETLDSSAFTITARDLKKLAKAILKFLIFSTVFELVQKVDFYERKPLEFYILMYLMGGSLYFCFTVLLDMIGLFWKFVFNMEPKELFNAPFMASSPRDFWSRRWNMFFRNFFHKLFFRNIKSLSNLRATVYAMAVFVISGLLHEYVCWVIMGKISGLNFMFFMIHGIVTTGQVIIQTVFPVLKHVPRWLAVSLQTVFLAFTMPLFIGPYVQAGFVRNVSLPFSLAPTLRSSIFQYVNYV